jgi:peptidoglycan/xylan/chitin deacetylase (PgdA/CDA1 family)
MSRIALPQNYIKSDGTLVEGFETLTGWSGIAGSAALDTVNYKTGSASLKLTSLEGGNAIYTETVSLDLSKKSRRMDFEFFVYDVTAFNYLSVILSSSASLTTSFTAQVSNAGGQIRNGWNKFSVGRANWSATGAESWNNTMVRLRVMLNAKSGKIAAASIDSLFGDSEGIGRLLLTFDDGYSSVYDQAFSYMNPRGIVGTSYVAGYQIDNGIGFMTKPQLTELYNAGWAIGNHTYNHVDMSGYTRAQAYAQLNPNKTWLINGGFVRSADHACYPVGGYNDDVLLAMADIGAKTGRTTKAGNNYEFTHPYELTIREVSNISALATVKGYVDEALSREATVILMFHKIVETPTVSTEWSIANFQALCDYIAERKIPTVAIDEWYRGLKNPRKLSSRLAA